MRERRKERRFKASVNKQQIDVNSGVVITCNDQVKALQNQIAEIKEQGFKDGSNGFPLSDITDLSGAEKSWRTVGLTVLQSIRSLINQEATKMTKDLEMAQEDLLTEKEGTQSEKHWIEYYEEDKKSLIKEIELEAEGDEVILEERLAYLKKDLEAHQKAVKSEEHILNHKPMLRLVDSTWKYLLLLLVLASIEGPINVASIVNSGLLDNGAALLIGIGLSLLLLLASHLTAQGVAHKKIRWQLYAGVISFIFFFVVIAVFRASDIILTLINTGVYLTGIILGFHRSSHRQFFLLKHEIKVLRYKIATAERDLKLIAAETEKLKRAVITKIRTQVEEKINNQKEGIKALREMIKTKEINLSSLKEFSGAKDQEVDGLFLQGISEYRSANENSRSDTFEPVGFWKTHTPKSLLFAFPPVEFKTSTNGKYKGNIKSLVNSFIILIVSFLLSGCGNFTTQELPQFTEITLCIDVTDSLFIDASQISESICKNILQVDQDIGRSAKVNIGIISDRFIEPVTTINLVPGKDFFTRNEKAREGEIKAFQENVKLALNSVIQNREPLQYTQLHHALCCEYLPALMQSEADKKVLIVYSNLIEHTKELSFYQYRKTPNKLINDYSQIIDHFDQDCPLDSITDIEITIVHIPNKKEDALYVHTKKIWHKYLESRAAKKISFVTNL